MEHEAPFPGAPRIGITGAPGAGKSTLLDALLRVLRAGDQTVGIVAVDPSSQRTGGALLGDRMRLRSGAADPGVFIRSMPASLQAAVYHFDKQFRQNPARFIKSMF